MRDRLSYWTYIYFIQSTSSPYLVKIGQTAMPIKRKSDWVRGSSAPLRGIFVCVANTAAEELLHFVFNDIRACGKWFYPHAKLKSLVRAWKKAGMEVLTPDVAEATLPAILPGDKGLQELLGYYREAFRVEGIDGGGRRLSEVEFAFPMQEDVNSR